MSKRGFTLVELLVVVGIAAIVLAVAVPSLGPFVGDQRARAAAQSLMNDMVFARGEAARHNQRVQIVPAGGDWADGWQVQLAADGTPLRTQGALPADVDVCVASASLTGNLVYRPDGRLVRAFSGGADSILVGWLGESGNADNRVRRIRINMAGRPMLDVEPVGAPFLVDGGGSC